jgi:hypothetical protein
LWLRYNGSTIETSAGVLIREKKHNMCENDMAEIEQECGEYA